VEIKVDSHNHGPSIPSAQPAHRIKSITLEIKEQIIAALKVGQPVQVVLSTLRQTHPEITLTAKDIYNIYQAARIKQLDGKSPLHWLLTVCRHYSFNLKAIDYLIIYIGAPSQRI
jgi:hypothetical protein